MHIEQILRRKGTRVATVPPTATVADVVAALAEHGVGALVVSPDGEQLVGIVSERDVVRHLHLSEQLLDRPVTEIMTSAEAGVHTCRPRDTVDQLARQMTELRIRHVPVLVDGRLAGIVSIGDVVKSRIDELEFERGQLEDYIATG